MWCRAAAGRRISGRRAPGPGPSACRRGSAGRARDRRQPGDGAGRVDAAGDRARGAAVLHEPAPDACGGDPERRLGPRARAYARLDRGRQASGPACTRRAGRPDRLPARPQPRADRDRRRRARVHPRRCTRTGLVMRTTMIPGMANAHSHAFQLDLRGIGERPHPGDDFWSWRTEMYRLASSHDPESMRVVGDRIYSQMAAAGYTAVGEFHYVVHQPDGTPFQEPNAMAIALAQAAVTCGLEIVLLPAAYQRAGPGRPAELGQRRFCDPDVETFLERTDALRAWAAGRDGVSVGVAAHSVRAVEASWLAQIARYSEEHGLVRHVHACEQRRELVECDAEHGCSPIELLERTGFLGPRTSVVHGIHVNDRDIELLASSDSIVVTSATVTSRGCAIETPACGWPSAPTRRFGLIRSRNCGRWRRWRGASARLDSRCLQRPAATSGGRPRRTGVRASD